MEAVLAIVINFLINNLLPQLFLLIPAYLVWKGTKKTADTTKHNTDRTSDLADVRAAVETWQGLYDGAEKRVEDLTAEMGKLRTQVESQGEEIASMKSELHESQAFERKAAAIAQEAIDDVQSMIDWRDGGANPPPPLEAQGIIRKLKGLIRNRQ